MQPVKLFPAVWHTEMMRDRFERGESVAFFIELVIPRVVGGRSPQTNNKKELLSKSASVTSFKV